MVTLLISKWHATMTDFLCHETRDTASATMEEDVWRFCVLVQIIVNKLSQRDGGKVMFFTTNALSLQVFFGPFLPHATTNIRCKGTEKSEGVFTNG